MTEVIIDQFTADLKTLAWLAVFLVAMTLAGLIAFMTLRRR